MVVSRQEDRLAGKLASTPAGDVKGPRARMKKVLLAQAMELMQNGIIPSVSAVAEAAEVSRATAYRYFPSQAAMIQEAVVAGLGPILDWSSDSHDADERVADLLGFSLPRINQFEATHRAALWLSIDQWARSRAGAFDEEEFIARGSRRRLLSEALEPLRDRMAPARFDKLAQALSLIFGIEALVVLKDIWGLEEDEARDVLLWAASALVRGAVAESGERRPASRKTGKGRKAQSN